MSRSLRSHKPLIVTVTALGITGALISTSYAAGFATSSTKAGTISDATNFGADAGDSSAIALSGLVTKSADNLTVNYAGSWGSVAASTKLFNVDLTHQAGTFYLETTVTNSMQLMNKFDVEQFNFVQYNLSCDKVGSAGPGAAHVLSVDSTDSKVVFNGLAGGSQYCFGVTQAGARADEQTGTFLRRPAAGLSPTTPDAVTFLAILNRTVPTSTVPVTTPVLPTYTP